MVLGTGSKRVNWIDTWRGLAVLAMLVFHLFFDLNYFGIQLVEQTTLPWTVLGDFVRVSFLLLVGISLFLSSVSSKTNISFRNKQLNRVLVLLIVSLGITLITFLLFPEEFIRFGILHLITIGILLSIPLVNRPYVALGLGIFCLLVFLPISALHVEHDLLMIFGVYSDSLVSLDHFPLFPWLGYVFIGIFFAHKLSELGFFETSLASKSPINLMGRHALFVYLIHQPIFVLTLYLFFIK